MNLKTIICLLSCLAAGQGAAERQGDPFKPGYEPKMPEQPDHLIPVDPHPGEWVAPYNKQLDRHLGLKDDYLLRMIVRPSFTGEYLVRLEGDPRIFTGEDQKNFFVTSSKADKSIWYSIPENNSEKAERPVKVSKHRKMIPKATAHRVYKVWSEMILRTRYPNWDATGLDGVTIEFARHHHHGETWSPNEGSLPHRLWKLGDALLAYCEAPEDKEKEHLESIHRQVAEMEKQLKAKDTKKATDQKFLESIK